MTIKTKRLNFDREKQLVINLILNKEFCSKVLPVLDDKYFKSEAVKTVIHWVKNYYESYNVPPKEQIQQIFEQHSQVLDKEVAVQIRGMLEHLSQVSDSKVHNIKFLIDNAHVYLKNLHTQLQIEAATHFAEKNDYISAENAMLDKFKGIAGSSYEVLDFSDKEARKETIRWMIQSRDPETAFFMLNGRLGEFIGPMNQGWFVSFLAPAKRGKTTYMLDAAVSAIHRKLNTLVFSHEMQVEELHARYLIHITGALPAVETYTAMTPIMDCLYNQNGSCEKEERVGYDSVIEEDIMTDYDDRPDWEVCTVCRGTKYFKPSSWKIPIEKVEISEAHYAKKAEVFDRYYAKHCRAMYIPSNTVGVSDLKDEMENLMNSENFVPDVIVIDYADLLIGTKHHQQKRHELDEIWEDLRSWAKSSNILIITASQTNRSSASSEFIRDTDVAEDYSKIAKLDVAIGLCQTDTMKERGMMNINKVAHRHNGFVQNHVCTVLQDMSLQQSTLDSEFSVA